MKVKTSELSGAALDWAVAKCEGIEWSDCDLFCKAHQAGYAPSQDWDQGGPIIEREEISIDYRDNETQARKWSDKKNDFIIARAGKRQGLIASMRCYVASKLGDEVEIPQELL